MFATKFVIIAAIVAAFATPVLAATGVEFDAPSPVSTEEGTAVEFPSPADSAGEGKDIPLPEQGEGETPANETEPAPLQAGQATPPERGESASSPAPTAVGAARSMRSHQWARPVRTPAAIEPWESLGTSRHRALWREAHQAGVVSRSWVEARIRAATQAGTTPAAGVENSEALPQRTSAGADAPKKKGGGDMVAITIIAIIAILAAMVAAALAAAALVAALRDGDELPAAGEVVGTLPAGLVVEASGWAGGRGWRVSSAPAPATPGAARAGTARAAISPDELGS